MTDQEQQPESCKNGHTCPMRNHVECPTCGASYENNIVEKFSLAFDAEVCLAAADSAQAEIISITDEIDGIQRYFADNRNRHARLWELLETKQGSLSLAQVLMGEARGQTIETLQSESDSLEKISLSC